MKPPPTELQIHTVITTHQGADFDALAAAVGAVHLYPDASIVFAGSLNPNVREFVWNKQITVRDFSIIPHLVDHSGFSAFAFEIEAAGKRVFYSGDFRDHGNLSKAMEALYARVTPGVGSTMEIRWPTMRFSRLLLPTLGRPTMATVGRGIATS